MVEPLLRSATAASASLKSLDVPFTGLFAESTAAVVEKARVFRRMARQTHVEARSCGAQAALMWTDISIDFDIAAAIIVGMVDSFNH